VLEGGCLVLGRGRSGAAHCPQPQRPAPPSRRARPPCACRRRRAPAWHASAPPPAGQPGARCPGRLACRTCAGAVRAVGGWGAGGGRGQRALLQAARVHQSASAACSARDLTAPGPVGHGRALPRPPHPATPPRMQPPPRPPVVVQQRGGQLAPVAQQRQAPSQRVNQVRRGGRAQRLGLRHEGGGALGRAAYLQLEPPGASAPAAPALPQAQASSNPMGGASGPVGKQPRQDTPCTCGALLSLRPASHPPARRPARAACPSPPAAPPAAAPCLTPLALLPPPPRPSCPSCRPWPGWRRASKGRKGEANGACRRPVLTPQAQAQPLEAGLAGSSSTAAPAARRRPHPAAPPPPPLPSPPTHLGQARPAHVWQRRLHQLRSGVAHRCAAVCQQPVHLACRTSQEQGQKRGGGGVGV
jgi:hypothetical protein